MKALLGFFLVGLLFGVGLVLAGMTMPAKVIAFLDLGGDWDPSLAFVMGGAILVHAVAYRFVPRLGRPLGASRWALPTRRDIDRPLVLGAVFFGLGWGMGGYCPGPAFTSMASGATTTWIFVAAMVGGMGIHHLVERMQAPDTTEG